MREFEDLTGQKFGYLTILELKTNGKQSRSWLCKCQCGKILRLGESRLFGNKSRNPDKSCGCMQLKQNRYTITESKLYSVWQNMIHRCHNPKFNIYYKYGAKGTKVCDDWRNDFETFLNWSKSNGYEEGLTIDRIDFNNNYSPDNCRWVTHEVQAVNKGLRSDNRSGYVGVSKYRNNKYRAHIMRKGVRKFLGVFDNPEEGAKAVKEAREYYKKYGRLPD